MSVIVAGKRRDPALDLNPRDVESRRHWKAAMALMWSRMPMSVLRRIVSGGSATFVRRCQSEYADHCMKREDFVDIFRIIRHCVDHGRPPASYVLSSMGVNADGRGGH